MNKWNVEFTDKVIEVEEEASILNPTNRGSSLQARDVLGGVRVHSPIEEFPRPVRNLNGKSPTKI